MNPMLLAVWTTAPAASIATPRLNGNEAVLDGGCADSDGCPNSISLLNNVDNESSSAASAVATVLITVGSASRAVVVS